MSEVPVIVQIRDFLFGRLDEGESVRWEADVTHTPATDRTLTTTRHRIGVEGSLTNIQVDVISGSIRNDVYVRVTLEDESQKFRGLLCRGYIDVSTSPHGAGAMPVKPMWSIRLDSYSSKSSAPVLVLRGTILRGRKQVGGWTGTDKSSLEGAGAVYYKSGTDPAVGIEISETVPTGARWRLRHFRAQLVTSTQTATRTIRLTFVNGSTVFFAVPAGASVTANSTRTFMAPSGYTSIETSFDSANETRFPIPTDLILFAGDKVTTVTGAIKSNDNWGQPFMQIEEWLEP